MKYLEGRKEVILNKWLPPYNQKVSAWAPTQIVARLLNAEHCNLACGSTIHLVARHANEHHHRYRVAVPRRLRPPRRHRADRPNHLWNWDVTDLKMGVLRQFYCLHVVLDIHSRKIVGTEALAIESVANNTVVTQHTILREQCVPRLLISHADNDSAIKRSSLDSSNPAQRHPQIFQHARERHPYRWSGRLRNWQPIGSVWLNPEPDHCEFGAAQTVSNSCMNQVPTILTSTESDLFIINRRPESIKATFRLGSKEQSRYE